MAGKMRAKKEQCWKTCEREDVRRGLGRRGGVGYGGEGRQTRLPLHLVKSLGLCLGYVFLLFSAFEFQ